MGPLKQILSPSLLHIAMYWAQPLEEVPYLLDQCCTCHHPGVQFVVVVVVVVERLSFSWAQVVFPPPWEFEREQVLMPFFSLHFACCAWHWVTLLLLLLTESQQACAFSSVLYTVEGLCIEADRGVMSVSNGSFPAGIWNSP